MPTRLRYQFFDAGRAGYPKPQVSHLPLPGQPVPRAAESGEAAYELVGAGRPTRTYARGRYALRDAFALCGAGPGKVVLAPATHCRTMLDPAIRLGATVVLYPLSERLEPDEDGLRHIIRSSTVQVSCLLLTHYFGVPQDTARFRRLCDQEGIELIEDCSHAAVTPRTGQRLGELGRYAVTSPYKFFPNLDGGLLIARDDRTPMPTRRPHRLWRREVSVLVALISATLRKPAGAALDAAVFPATAGPHAELFSEADSDEVSALYDPIEEACPMSWGAQLALRASPVDASALARRQAFDEWARLAAGLARCHPLHHSCPPGCVPYMFPLVLHDPDRDFPRLKIAGVPVWRWDEYATSACAVSRSYSRSLLHLPCHQGLTASDRKWMHATVSGILA